MLISRRGGEQPLAANQFGLFTAPFLKKKLAVIWGNSDFGHSDFGHSDFAHTDFTHPDFGHSDFGYFLSKILTFFT